MSENLLNFASSEGPYVHSKAYNFRSNIAATLSQSKTVGLKDIADVIARMENIKNELRTEALSFLDPWGGDYKIASKQLFLGEKQDTSEKASQNLVLFRKIAIDVMNTKKFVEMIMGSKKMDNKKIAKILKKYGVNNIQSILKKDFTIEELVDEIMQEIFQNPEPNKRIDLTGKEKEVVRLLIGNLERKFAKDRDSLVKQLREGISKAGSAIDTTKIYKYYKTEFLSKVPADKQEAAESFLSNTKKDFIARLKKIELLDYSNITGKIGESLVLSILNDNEMQFSFMEVGDMDEDTLVKKAESFAKSLGIKDTKQIVKNDKNPSAVKSGTDWIIANGNGKMVRAQVKNSAILAEELRESGKTSFPQTVKVQDNIYYSTLKSNLQNYSKDSNLTDADWINLEYLIANVLWIRANGSPSANKGDGYRSGVSGVMLLIEQILSKEIGYFLGVAANAAEDGMATVIGASNIFFVLDDTILFPTYKIFEAVIAQVRAINSRADRLQVTLGNSFDAPSLASFEGAKAAAKEKDGPWKSGDPYGTNLLAVGREAGNTIINSLKIDRINYRFNIDEILASCFNK